MSLLKLDYNSKFLIIGIKYNIPFSFSKIKKNIFSLIDYYDYYDTITWYLIQNINSKENIIYYYIYTLNNVYINLSKIKNILESFIRFNNHLYISICCYPEKIFIQEITKNNNNLSTIYIKKKSWKYQCMHDNTICNNNCNNKYLIPNKNKSI